MTTVCRHLQARIPVKTLIENLGRALLLLGICPFAIATSAPDASAAPQKVEKKEKLEKKEQKQEGQEKRELTPEEKAIKEAKAERDRALAKAEEDYQKALAEVRQGSGGEEAKEAKKQELAKQYRDQRDQIMKAFVQKVSSLKGNSDNPRKGDNPPGERGKGDNPPAIKLTENPDILSGLSRHPQRPPLLIGFAAETEHVLDHARAKLAKKGCDWIVANDVSGDVMGGENNTVHIVTNAGVDSWDKLSKDAVARKLVERIADALPPAA